jgi:small GTP-binding protein
VAEAPEQKTAFISIVGRPNVGKSSILNAMLGTKVAIVSRKPQTTRTRIMGVLTRKETQLVFIDTPRRQYVDTAASDCRRTHPTRLNEGWVLLIICRIGK